MYVMQEHAPHSPARARRAVTRMVEPALAQCVSTTGLNCAFIAVARETRGRSTLVVRARFARAGQHAERLPQTMRRALESALESGCPVLAIGRRNASESPWPRVLIAAPIMDNGGPRAVLGAIGYIPAPYVAAVRDVQRIAAGLNARTLLASHDMSDEGEFIRAASARQDVLLHELRAPLAAANLLLERITHLRAGDTVSDDTYDQMRAAHTAVREAQSIVRTISQLNTLNQDALPVTPRPLLVQEVIERAIALLPGSIGRLRRLAPEGLPAIVADPLWLTHILTNLLENAMTHTPAPQIADMTAALSRDRKRVVISITSYGAGIPVAEQQRILQPYQRVAPADDLTSKGLGLSIARYLVTAMRGELWLDSDGCHSATFHVALPVAPHAAC